MRFVKGQKFTEQHRINIGLSHSGKKAYQWKGDRVSYRVLHHWIRKYKGIPIRCFFCGKLRSTPKSIHWANKSGNYKREIEDWITLCVPCHKKYDKNMKQTHKEKILEILDDGHWHSNFEIHEKTQILRYSARILDLKKQGYLIEGKDDEFDRAKYWYRLLKLNLNGVIIKPNDEGNLGEVGSFGRRSQATPTSPQQLFKSTESIRN